MTIPLFLVVEVAVYECVQYGDTCLLYLCGVLKIQVPFDYTFIVRNLYRALLYIGFSTGYYFLMTYLAERRRTEELNKQRLKEIIKQQRMEQELMKAQNAFLKAQIKPHLLFNTLDFVYHNVNQYSAIAGEAIVRLSEMMRFAINSGDTHSEIMLADEIEQVENLMQLYQMRKNNQLNVELSYTREVKQFKIIPLVLLTLVENIFKHGNLLDPEWPASIAMQVENNLFCIYTSNLIETRKSAISNNSGLNNIKSRLKYAYENEASISYKATADFNFYVKVEIPIKFLTLPV